MIVPRATETEISELRVDSCDPVSKSEEEDDMSKNDAFEAVEETVVEVDVGDKAPESIIGGVGLGIVVATETYGIPSIDVADEDAEDEVVGEMGIVDVTVALGVVKAAGKVTAAEIGKPNKVLEDAVMVLIVDEGIPILVSGNS